jgi:DNA gyrase subunit A
MKTSSKIGKVTSINLVDDITEMMVISQFGKIMRIDTKSVRSAGRTSGRPPPQPRHRRQGSQRHRVIPPKTPKSTAETVHCFNN